MKTQKIFRLWSVLLLASLLWIPVGYAQDDESEGVSTTFTDTFDGYVKHSSAVRLHELDRFTKIHNSLELKYSDWFNDHLGLTMTGRAVYDGVYDVENNLAPEDEEDYRAYLSLREAVLDLTFGNVDLHLGKQQVVWGKTDGFRVTDVVNPLDIRDTASTEFLDQRIPLWMINLEYYVTTDFALQALIIPDLRFNKLPALQFPEGTPLNATEEPDVSLKNTEYGGKLTGYLKGWDFTLNYLYAWDDIPVFKQVLDENTGTLAISPEHERLHIVGGTVATIVWDGVIRGEFAAKIGKYFSVDDPTVSDMAVKKTLLNYALAFERDLVDIHWIAQALQETILEYNDAMTTDEVSTYATLNGSKDFLGETLEIAALILYDINNEQWTFRPSVEYAYNDAVTLSVGVDFVAGDKEVSDNDSEQVYVEVKYGF